jgi:hypothetical protein
MTLEDNIPSEDILDQLEKIEALGEEDPNFLDRIYHKNTKISICSS